MKQLASFLKNSQGMQCPRLTNLGNSLDNLPYVGQEELTLAF